MKLLRLLLNFSSVVCALALVSACGSRSLGVGAANTATDTSGSGLTGGGSIISTPTPTPGSTTGAWNANGTTTGTLNLDTTKATLSGNPGGTFVSRVLDKGDTATTWQSLSALSDRPLNIALPDNRGADNTTVYTKGTVDMAALANTSLFHMGTFDGTNVVDASGQNHGGTCDGCALTTNRGFFGTPSLAFSGTDTGFKTGTGTGFNGTGPFTISMWFATKFTAANGTGTLYSQRDANNYDGAVVLAINRKPPLECNLNGVPGELSFHVWNGNCSAIQTNGAAVNDGNWHYVVATRDAGNLMTIYVDGIVKAQGTPNNTVNAKSNLRVCVGGDCRTQDNGNGFKGQIQEAAFFNSALSAANVIDTYVRARPGIGFQVRVGNDNTFANNTQPFVGPDNSTNTFFLPTSGATGALPTPLTMTNAAALVGRYFQFQIAMAPMPSAPVNAMSALPTLLNFNLNPSPF